MPSLFPYKLRDWIDETQLSLWNMCANTHPAALYYIEDLLKNDPENYLDWGLLSANPICIDLIENKLEMLAGSCGPMESGSDDGSDDLSGGYLAKRAKFVIENACWDGISMNEAAMHLIKQNPDKINLELMCHNTHPEAIEILKKNRDKINWGYLAQNPAAIDMVLEHINTATDEMSTLFWMDLFRNPAAIPYIKRNPWLKQKCVYTCSLCHNPKFMELIDDFPLDEKYINWGNLSSNPCAIELLEIEMEKNPDNVEYMWLSMNPAIFVYDYASMKEKNANLNEEIVKEALHPRRIAKYLDMGFDISDL